MQTKTNSKNKNSGLKNGRTRVLHMLAAYLHVTDLSVGASFFLEGGNMLTFERIMDMDKIKERINSATGKKYNSKESIKTLKSKRQYDIECNAKRLVANSEVYEFVIEKLMDENLKDRKCWAYIENCLGSVDVSLRKKMGIFIPDKG